MAILHDHHKDSFGHIKAWESRRDRMFFLIATLVASLCLGVYFPTTVESVFTEPVTALGAEVNLASLPVEILASFGWSVLFALSLRYCQASITVDRQYDYLHVVESRMAALSGGRGLFQREGRAYLSDYPAFSKWAHFFYSGLFPLIVVGVAAWLITVEVNSSEERFHAVYDGLMWLGVTTSFFLYRLWPIVRAKWSKRAPNKPLQPGRPSADR